MMAALELHNSLSIEFLNTLKYAESVIAFHFTPKQKKFLVDLVKKISPTSTILAIGDGANDV